MSYEFYKILHFIAIIAVFLGLGAGIMAQMLNQGKKYSAKKWSVITHGVGLVVVLISGFGLLARISNGEGTPNWIWIKLLVWLALGGILALISKFPEKSKLWWFTTLALALVAILTVVTKPI